MESPHKNSEEKMNLTKTIISLTAGAVMYAMPLSLDNNVNAENAFRGNEPTYEQREHERQRPFSPGDIYPGHPNEPRIPDGPLPCVPKEPRPWGPIEPETPKPCCGCKCGCTPKPEPRPPRDPWEPRPIIEFNSPGLRYDLSDKHEGCNSEEGAERSYISGKVN